MKDMKVTFVQINKENSSVFAELMQSYSKELDEHQNRNTDSGLLRKWTNSIIDKQFDEGRCLKLCCYNAEIIGFLYGKIDRSDDKGFKKVGYGNVLEFYVTPVHRIKSYGKTMYQYIERFFRKNGVKNIYLTADPVTGKPFWEAMGFVETGAVSPENKQAVYEKELF